MTEFCKIKLNIGIGWFGLMLGIGLLDLPFRYFLKDILLLGPLAMAWFFAIANIPTYTKPLIGVITDTVELFGTRRKYYLLFGLFLCSIFYALLGFSNTYKLALGNYFVLNIFQILVSIILGALIVEYGKKFEATGRLSALRVSVIKVVGLIVGPIGGYLALQNFHLTTFTCSIFIFLLIPFFYFLLNENQLETNDSTFITKLKIQFRNLTNSKPLILAALLLFLLKISPGFNIPLFYHQTDVLKFNPQFIGILSSVIAVCGLCGALLYGIICKRFNLRTLLIFSIAVDSLDSLIYIGYNSHISAIIITATNGLTGMLAALPLYDLSARATPKGSESLGYALMLSVWNLADSISDVIGSKLFEFYHFNFTQLVWINTITTAMILFLIPFIPIKILNYTDKN